MVRDYQPIRRHSSLRSQAAEGAFVTTDQARQAWRESAAARSGLSPEDYLAAEASGVHLASDDYPEMGEVLRDRPDPGSVITVVGARREAAGEGPFYHGTYRDFAPGEAITTGHPANYEGGRDEPPGSWQEEHAYFTTEADGAMRHASNAAFVNGGEPRVYEVAPSGPYEPTPADVASFPRPVYNYRSGHPLQVIRRHASDTYGRPDDPRDEEYNGGPQDTGMYWAEPGQQEWKEEHLGPQEAVPPPPWAPAVMEEEMPPAMARLAQIEEARQFFGAPAPPAAPLRRRATTINGTQIDDHGDAPDHGTVSRASAPDSYDSRSTEGDGDPKWSDPVDKKDAEDFNGATVGMYPEGMSAGGGPSLPVGAYVAHCYQQPGQHELERHLWRDHGVSQLDLGGLRARSADYQGELERAHQRVSAGRPPLDWGSEAVPAHGRLMSPEELHRHLWDEHGSGWVVNPPSPQEMQAEHDALHVGGHPHLSERAGPPTAGPTGDEFSYSGHSGPIDPVFGSRVPWTSKERGTLHRWQDVPTGTWGDFVPSDEFPGSGARQSPAAQAEREEERARAMSAEAAGQRYEKYDASNPGWQGVDDYHPGDNGFDLNEAEEPDYAKDLDVYNGLATHWEHEDRARGRAHPGWFDHTLSHLAAFGPDPAEEANMRDHLLNHHGWTAESADRVEARGDRFTHMHDTLHQMGMANHGHQDPAEAARQRELSSRFGDPYQAPVRGYSHPKRGGTPLEDPADAISHAVPVNWQATFDKMPLRSWSALDPPHPHDDESSSLDSGPSEGDEGFPGLHDDFQSPDEWPLAGAGGGPSGPAYTQGARDGHGGRVFPPPPPPPMPATNGNEPPGEDGGAAGGKGKKIQIEVKAHLGAFTAAVADPRFRFEFTAAWPDVVAKAKRIRREGHVRITHASAGLVIGEVRGDHDTYESGLQRPPGKPQTIQHWACGCPWASFHQDKSLGTRYAGRPCSHVMALQYEAQARGMFGKAVARDEQAPAWSRGDVTVKSWPPYEGEPHAGRWAETWLAPSASLRSLGAGTPGSGWYDWDNHSRSMVERSLEDHLRSQRSGRGWETELVPNHHFVAAPTLAEGGVTHLLRAYHNGAPAGVIGVGASNNMKAWKVHHVHVLPGFRGQGTAGAMMDSFYDHARGLGAEWVDHGRNTGGGNPQLRGYAEPHPDMNIHNAHPDAGWNRYFHAPRVYHDMQANHAISPGTAPAPDWRSYNTWDDAHRIQVHNRWTKARGLPVSPVRGDWPGRPVNDFQEPQGTERPRQRGEQWREPVREPEPEPGSDRYNFGVTLGISRQATPDEARDAGWTPEERDAWDSQAGSHDRLSAGVPAQQATAALLAAGEDLAELIALARLGGFSALVRTADQANAPWGSENVSKHPPVKPYGATEPLNRDQSPASYGFLSAPDPDNWGGIQDDSAMQMPLTNTASLPPHVAYPDISDWQPEDQDSFGYADRANTAGPSTSLSPRDPGGIRMEESRRDCPCCGGSGEHDTGRECYGCDASGSADGYSGPSPCDGTKPYGVDSEGHQVELDPQDGWQHLDGSVSHEDGTTVTDRPVRTGELRDEPEPALPSTTGDDIEATAAADGGEDQSPPATAGLGEFGASAELPGVARQRPGSSESVREEFRRKFGGAPMGDLARETSPQAQQPSPVGQEPGMGSMDELLSPDNPSVQTIGQRRTTGQQQWSGGGADSDEVAVPPGEAHGSIEDIVASFQRSAGARQFGGGTGAMAGDGDIAGAARQYLSKTADALPDAEAADLIAEGRGQRARNLGLLRLEGTHYEDEAEDLARRGVSLDDYDDDVISV